MEDMEKAKDKIMMGAERRSMVMNEKEKEMTAYHEAGHAIVGRVVPNHDPVYKVSIIPRGRALGVTMFLPTEDKYSNSKEQLESQISTLYGGRIAEELIYGKEAVTTGASNDIQRATKLAHDMVTKWGLSDNMGPMSYGEDEGEVFLGRSVTQHKSVSDLTAKAIDEDIRTLINRNYQRAEKILTENLDKLHAMTALLIKYETIDSHQIDAVMEGREPGAPKDWTDTPSAPNEDSSSSDAETSGKPADQLH
jgi:cell division protease FtsH